MRGKAYAVAILADRGVLRAEILRFGDEVRSARDLSLPKPDKIDRERVRRMRKLVERLSAKTLDEKELRDEEPKALLELARAKQRRGKDLVEAPEEPSEQGAEIVDIMTIIRQRLREKKGQEGSTALRTARGGSTRAHAKRRGVRVSRSARRAAARRH
jgi:DNA end-binding protein Ku